MATMFDTNFSFLSSTSEPLVVDYSTSTDISPFTSRCSSPQVATRRRSSHYRSTRDTRFDAYRSGNPSITALTAQLQSHVLTERTASLMSAEDEPSTESEQDDEGFYEGAGSHTPATSVSDVSSSDFDPTLYDLSMSELSATSSPRPSLSLEAQALSSYTMRRRQRQALVRLQCLARRAPDLAMLIEECHPSSLPLAGDAFCWIGAASRSNSTSSTSGTVQCGRIEKDRPASVRKVPRMRKRT